MTPSDPMDGVIARMAQRIVAEVPAVRAVSLGGSRARGTPRENSDWDLGLYYRGALEADAVAVLARLASGFSGERVEMAAPGGWGPWVNGGAWLRVDGRAVDWILRDLDRVERVWADCRAGRYEIGRQPGHPLGYWSHGYPGEVATCRVLADPHGELSRLRSDTARYPDALRSALAEGTWEADFVLRGAAKAATANDALYVAQSLSFAFGILTHALFAHHRSWCPNEKGALAGAARLPAAPEHFAERVTAALRNPSPALAVEEALRLTDEVRAAVRAGGDERRRARDPLR